ncbi:MAG TPA: cysteine peptidase family C39 domain-containing protein, partial [Polyangia bacterium]|nr:cysteine peptidase family C39 domain-containing protein [Polyangia bacterium]
MTSPSAEPEPRSKRRWLAPETIQTSAMDCGPATLKSLLEGFGVPVSYGRLREACQTSVDGTSIDTLEDLSRRLGLEAEQVMVPLDHLLLPESRSLPAIVVVRLPSGLTHFVVVWRVHGRWVQVMDPARGRRWMRADALLRDVYVHTMPIPAEMFRDWAGSDEFLLALRRRLARLGAPDGGEAFVSRALADASWRGPAALDA